MTQWISGSLCDRNRPSERSDSMAAMRWEDWDRWEHEAEIEGHFQDSAGPFSCMRYVRVRYGAVAPEQLPVLRLHSLQNVRWRFHPCSHPNPSLPPVPSPCRAHPCCVIDLQFRQFIGGRGPPGMPPCLHESWKTRKMGQGQSYPTVTRYGSCSVGPGSH